jgi:hypothetical protein
MPGESRTEYSALVSVAQQYASGHVVTVAGEWLRRYWTCCRAVLNTGKGS